MKAWKLLSSSARWTKGSFARNNRGYVVDHHDDNACRWCAVGAIYKCYGEFSYKNIVFGSSNIACVLPKLQEFIKKNTLFYNISDWNDNSDYKTVREVLKKLDI
jgi:hypothetical protein